MPIGDLSSKVSQTASEEVNIKNNPPKYADGFGDEEDDDFFESLFDDIDLDDFGSSTPSPSSSPSSLDSFGSFGSGSSSFGSSGFGSSPFGTPVTFGSPKIGGLNQGQLVDTKKEPDALDITIKAVGEASLSTGKVIVSMIKSVSTRNADDIGKFSKNILLTGIGIAGTSLLFFLIGIFGGLSGMRSLAFDLLISSLLSAGTGLAGIGGSALRIITRGEYVGQSISDIPEINSSTSSDSSLEEDISDDDYDDIFDELFGGDDDEDNSLDEFDFSTTSDRGSESTNTGYEQEKSNTSMADMSPKELQEKFSGLVKDVQSNQPLLTREYLFNTFKNFFMLNNPDFSKKEEIDSYSSEFHNLEVLCTQALAAAAKKDIKEIESKLTQATSTFFCYILRMNRVKGLNKLDDIAREIEAYFRDDAEDESVVATVYIERDYYKIVVTKGVRAVVTIGDCLQLPEVREFFLNTKNRLPIIAGVDDYGNPILADAKNYTTIMIAGKPRSGKSWYVLSIIIVIMIFNLPEDVQLLLIDPKQSTLFTYLSFMPHVCGLHDDSNILQVLRDVIEVEAPRRKKILKDNMCENIWDLRERKGIKIPVLYIVIDEVMTVISNLAPTAQDKEFNRLLSIIVTQLPSLGIYLLLVPHRATGVVDKTMRVNMAFTAAVRAEEEVVKETLDVKKWDRPLTQPGDIALKLSGVGLAKFVRGATVAYSNDKDISDSLNFVFIENVAKTFYKMGVYIPDMSTIGCGYNRNDNKIKEMLELGGNGKKVQFDLDELNNIENEDLSTLISEADLFND